ncbi:TRAP transporter small permease [Oceanisphaera sp. KMM 10153]|uniref:TRAP transporter small permease n=1 Tax=Oceanisphaera submarina TaxID=3390193 RepID=UPI003975ABB0
MKSILSRTLDGIVKALFFIGVLSGITMTLLILISTLSRYLANQPLSFSDELAGLLFLSMAFNTLPYVLNTSGHISLNLLTNRLPAHLQVIFTIITASIFMAFAVVFSYQAWQFMEFSRAIQSRSDISEILLWPWMALMPFSMALCILVEIKKVFFNQLAENTEEISL